MSLTHETSILGKCPPSLQPRSDIIGVVLAEGYPLLLEGMQSAFSLEAGFRVFAACGESDEVLRAVRRHRPDVLVMALEIPGDALRVVRQLADEGVPTRIVLYTAGLDESVMFQAMRLGVRGIVLKTMSRQLLVQCVRKVHRGATWVEQVSMSRLVDQLVREESSYRDIAARLSRRELEIVQMVAAGSANKEIAAKLGVCVGTIKAHLHHVYQKLGVKGRLGLMLYARDKGLCSTLFADRLR